MRHLTERAHQFGLILASTLCAAAILSCGDPVDPTDEKSLPVTSVTLSGTTITMNAIGDTALLTVVAKVASGAIATNRTVTWSVSNPNVLKVQASGVVIAVGNGTATVTATVEGVSDQRLITVKQVATSISITPASMTFGTVGDTGRFSGIVKDRNGNAIPFTWTSTNANIVRIDSTGLATAMTGGSVAIRVSAGLVSQATAIVEQIPVSLELTKDSVQFSALEDWTVVGVQMKDARGYPIITRGPLWSTTDAAVATIAPSRGPGGYVKSIKDGQATIYARIAGLVDSVSVVVRQVASEFTLLPDKATVWAGTSVVLTAGIRDKTHHLMSAPLASWSSSDPSIATVSNDGQVTSLRSGTVTITATDGNLTATSTLTVQDNIAGTVDASVTLRKANSPYRVTGNVTVASSGKLRIEPGVTLLFSQGTRLTVNGTLEAVGTVQDSIRFTSVAANPGVANWNGIAFGTAASAVIGPDSSYASGSVISYAEIAYATQIITAGTGPYLSHTHIHHLGFQGILSSNDERGVISGGGFIRDNLIENNTIAGLRFTSGWIKGNVIQRNSVSGIQVSPTSRVVIEDNRILENRADSGGGIHVFPGNGQVSIRYNEIRGNVLRPLPGSGAALAFSGVPTVDVSYNTIEGNTCEGDTVVNAPTGLGRNGPCGAILFAGNSTGTVTMDHNNIVNPDLLFEMLFQSTYSSRVIGESNYWNVASATSLQSRIRKNSAPLVLTVDPVLTARVSTAGPRPP